MNLRNIDLNLLTVFDAVMKEGNLTKAAKKIGMSQPAVSDSVSRLRYLFKDELFIRTGHGVKPTPKAIHYSSQIRRILDLVVMMLSESKNFDFVTSKRKFNLILGDYGELVVLPRLMHWLNKMSSGVSINVRAGHKYQIKDALSSGEIDLLLSIEPIDDPNFSSSCVTVDPLVCMVSSEHPIIKDNLSLEQYLKLPHIIIEWVWLTESIVDNYLESQGLARHCHTQVHSFFDMPRVVASTNMISSIPAKMAHHFAETHKLKILPIPIPEMDIPFYLNWHKNFESEHGNTWIREAIAELINN